MSHSRSSESWVIDCGTCAILWSSYRDGERKEAIDKKVLKDALQKAQRKIPKDCRFTLVNALNAGVLDRKDGKFSVNSVGENRGNDRSR